MYAFSHHNFAVEPGSINSGPSNGLGMSSRQFPKMFGIKRLKRHSDGVTPPDRMQRPATGRSGRFGRNGGASLLIVAAAVLALLLSLLAGVVPAQAQSADVPSAPREITVTTEDGGVVLSWSAPAHSGASGIQSYQIRNAEGPWIPSGIPWISVGSQTSGAFRQLTNGTLYTFEVRAVNSDGHGPAASVQAIPNIPTTVSVSPVQATVTEGTDAVYRFSRVGRTAESLTVRFDVSGHVKVMSPFTHLLSFSNGLSAATSVTFAEGETETTLALTSEADRENEGDGEISVRIRDALEYDVGSDRKATVLVEDDDIPVVSLRWISPAMTVQGDTWVGSMVEGEDIQYEIECTGGTLAPDGETLRIPVHVRELLNHPIYTHYGHDYKTRFPCSDQPREGYLQSLNDGGRRFVGPDNGRIKIDILPQVRDMTEYPEYVVPFNTECYGSPGDVRFCPKFSFGSVTAVDIEVLNRNPTITVEAIDEAVNEGDPARFKLTRIWTSDWLNPEGLLGASTDVDFTVSEIGGYVTSPQNGQETFAATETEIIVEIPTVNDGLTGDDGQVTFEILAGSEETQSGNIGGHYEVYDRIDGITPPGGNSRMATVRILNRDEMGVEISETALTVPEGDSRTYTVALLSQPTGPVTVTVSAAGDPDVTVRPASLTFTATTWSQAQTVTVSAAQDGDAVDDAATISHAVSGGGYDAVAVSDVSVAVGDDDTASTVVALSVLPETVDENAGSTSVEVTGTLDAAARASDTDVSVSVSAVTASAGDFAAVPDFTLTIPAGATEGTASFSLAPVNDAIDEDAETISVGGTVQGLTVTAGTVTIADDDTAGVDVSSSALTVPEGDSRTYTVALLSQPTGPVTVTVSAAGDPDVTVRPASLTFTATTWSQAQTVTVSAAQDGDAVDDAATISHAVSGGGYDAVAVSDVSVAVGDDDTLLQAPVLTVAWPGFELVRLEWRAPPDGGSSISGYEVHVERVDNGSVVHDWEPAGTALEHTVTGLENDVEYRFRVRAVNPSGQGAPSNPLTATPGSLILTIVPHDNVDTIVEGEFARFDILLSGPLAHWIELDVRYTYSGEMMLNPISRDTTQYGPRTQASSLPRVVATLDDSAIEPDGSVTLSLLPGDGYKVGDLSSATIRILDNDGGRAPAAPTAPTVSTLSPTALEATWNPPSDLGNPSAIESYDVQYRKAGEADWLDGPFGVAGTRAVLEGLEAGTSYEVRVLARNARNPRNPDRVHAENWSVPGAGITAPSSALTVSVAVPSGSPPAREGDVLAFFVTADPAPASDLRVNVVVSESGAMLQAPSPSEAVILAGTSEAVLEVATVDDAAHETASDVFVVIAPDPSYDRGEPVARRHVSDNDLPDPGGVPGKPGNPRAEPMSDTELRLAWDWPQDIAHDQITSWVVNWTVEPCGQTPSSWEAAQSLPAGAGDPTEFVLEPGRSTAAHFRVAAMLAGAEIGPWSEAVCADTTTVEQFESIGARVVNGPGSNGVWDVGETVEAELTFNRPVWVDDLNGRPSLAIVLDGARREAPWIGGGGTSTLLFAYEVTATEAGARVAHLIPNGLSLNGATVHDADGRHAPEHIDVTPVVTAVTVEAESDGLWSPGDEVRVHLTFNERVTVDTRGGRPSLGIVAGAAPEARAAYAGGSGSRQIVFGYVIPEAAGPASSVVVLANTLALEGGAMHRGELAADLRHPGARLDGTTPGPVPAFSVADASATEGGRLAFAVTLAPASLEMVTVAYATSDESAIAGTDYALAAGRLTFVPGQTQAVAEVAVHEDQIDEGVETLTFTLSGPSGAEIAKAQATGQIVDSSSVLTAWFEDVPEEHGGSNVFGFRLVFSEPVFDGSEPFDKNQVIQDALHVSGGTVTGRRRVNPGAFDQWILWVEPSGHGDVTVRLPATTGGCDIAGAICTPDGKALANAPTVTIQGLRGLSVADAEVQEGPGAALEFAVSLSRASSSVVTVDYATADGSAKAGSDYTATSGTLTFAAGEVVKIVTVPVLDDTIDEGSETLALTLSNPSGSNAWLADATATGTIRNTDLMPQAWLTRFGRTVADQVVDTAQDRLQAPPAVAGVQVTVAGQRIGTGASPNGRDSGSRFGTGTEDEHRLAALSSWLLGEAGAERSDSRAGYRKVEPRELLTGSSFQLTTSADGAGPVSLWGRGAWSRFDGHEGDLSLSGEVTSALIGTDWTRDTASESGEGSWTAGLMLSHARGEGSYRGASAGTVESTVTGLYPYGRYAVSDRVTVWGVAGHGVGTLTLTPEDGEAFRTDIDLTMAAAGLRGTVVQASADGGPEVSVETDALAVRAGSEAQRSDTGNLAAATGKATRLRLGLEGTWRGLSVAGGTLEPTLELGVRHDDGDGETGFGLDAGAGLAWSHPENGLKLRLSGRGILTHESSGFREQGVAGSLAWQPDGERGHGPSLAVTQTLGGASSGGADALFGRRNLAGLAANDGGDPLESRNLEVRFGYGLAVLGDRFTSTPELGLGMSNGHRDYSLGWRLNSDMRGDGKSLEFALEATRREAANDNAGAGPKHTAGFRITARW